MADISAPLTKFLNDVDATKASLASSSSSSSGLTSAEARKKIAKAARILLEDVEGPEASIWRVVWGIFDHFDTGKGEMTAAALAAVAGADYLLVVRIMRALTVVGIFVELGETRYAHNAASAKLTNSTFRALVIGLCGTFAPYLSHLPTYLASISFVSPADPKHTLFNYAADTALNFFDWLQMHPVELATFSAAMAASSALGHNQTVATISSLFPHSTTAEVLLVDVGGGRGRILEDVRTQRLDLIGRMIVQDLPEEIAGRTTSAAVEAIEHDFFTPQPVHGAHTYYLRHVLHDWPDTACRVILRQTIVAMTRGYSRVVVVDAVLPDVDASLFAALLDVNMMTLSGIERTERHWRDLLTSVGLSVEEMRMGQEGREGTIVAMLADD
ncbi:MAG: hypothetical protein Q9191_002478 [Dirinaria sp. TL-2023a]